LSRWDKYRVEEDTKPLNNKWDKYKVTPVAPIVPEKEGDSWPALIGKSALKGFSSIADLPALSAKATEKIINLGRKTSGNPSEVYWAAQNPNITNVPKITTDKNIPETNYSDYVPSGESLKSGIKNYTGVDLEPNPSSPAQRIVAQGADFGAAMLPWNWKAKGQNLFNQFKNAAKASKGATAVGLGSGTLQESGVNPFAADVISSVAVPHFKAPSLNGIKQFPANIIGKTATKLAGLGPNKINVKVAEAAKDLGIKLPATALTDSTLTGLIDQTVSKTPFFGNLLKTKYDQVKEKVHKNLENIYDQIGPTRTPEVTKKINDNYKNTGKLLPEKAVTVPTHTAKALNELNDSFYADISSPDRVKIKAYVNDLKSKIDPKITTQHGDINIPLQDYAVRKLIDGKVMINDIVYDLKGDSLERLKNINHAISEDIAEYGKKNPEWYKKFKEADKFYGDVAKRENTEKLLRNQATMDDAEELSYAALNNSINNKQNLNLIQRNTTPETFEKIKKLGIVSKAMVQKNRRVPNPSGTALTSLTVSAGLGLVATLFDNPSEIITGGGLSTIIGTAAATSLLTDERVVDLSLKLAQEKGKAKLVTAMKLNKRVKDITGYTLNSIYRASRNLNKEEEQDELQ
jgi:hypothetical protein